MTGLSEIQKAFQAYILSGAQCPDFILAGPALAAEESAAIYFSAYRLRLVEALASDYEHLAQYLGPEFEELALAYVRATPSVHRSLRWYGEGFSEFLALSGRGESAAIARFERALASAFDAKDAGPIGPADLQAIPPEDWAELTFEFHPSLQHVSLDWSAPDLWQSGRPQKLDIPRDYVIWRQRIDLRFREMDVAEVQGLNAARSGESFGDICQGLEHVVGPDEAPSVAALMLRNWLEPGMIVALGRHGPHC